MGSGCQRSLSTGFSRQEHWGERHALPGGGLTWPPVCNYGFSLADFKVLSLYLTFDIVIIMCPGVGLFVFILFGTQCASRA